MFWLDEYQAFLVMCTAICTCIMRVSKSPATVRSAVTLKAQVTQCVLLYRQNLERALCIHERINSQDYSSLADGLYALATLMIDAGRPSDALDYANRAVSMLSIPSNRRTPDQLRFVSSHGP